MARALAWVALCASLSACSSYNTLGGEYASYDDGNASYGAYEADYGRGSMPSFGGSIPSMGSSFLDNNTVRTALLGSLIGGAAGAVGGEPLFGAGVGAVAGAGIDYFLME